MAIKMSIDRNDEVDETEKRNEIIEAIRTIEIEIDTARKLRADHDRDRDDKKQKKK